MSGEGGRGGGFYLRTLIDIITMAAIFVTSEKNRTSDYLFFIRVRYSRYDNFARRREQEIEESLVYPSVDPLAFSHRFLNLINYRCLRNA